MGKQFVTETLVCGNCIHASFTNGLRMGILICHQRNEYVNAKAPFCNHFVANWVISDDETVPARQQVFGDDVDHTQRIERKK